MQHEHYSFDEVSWAHQMLAIKPDSLSARKLARIGDDIQDIQRRAREILERNNREQSVQNN